MSSSMDLVLSGLIMVCLLGLGLVLFVSFRNIWEEVKNNRKAGVPWWRHLSGEIMGDICDCGRPLHYHNAQVRDAVAKLVAEQGPNVLVTVNGRTYLVPRHYIALHGIKGEEVPRLGFPEVRR